MMMARLRMQHQRSIAVNCSAVERIWWTKAAMRRSPAITLVSVRTGNGDADLTGMPGQSHEARG